MQTEAAIDNDFVMHLAEIDNWSKEEHLNYVRLMFEELGVSPIMHELVYANELYGGPDTWVKTKALLFFENDNIKQKMLDSIADSQAKRNYYKMIFEEIYRDFRGELSPEIQDVFKDWKSNSSLGETHTVVMCFMLECGIFLSDDNDAKRMALIINRKRSFDLKVYNRREACERIMEIGSAQLNKETRRRLSHVPK